MNEKEIIEKLKHNWTAFGGLTKEDVAVLKKYRKHVGMLTVTGSLELIGVCDFIASHRVYRIDKRFNTQEEKKEKWFVPDVDEDGYYINRHGGKSWVYDVGIKGFGGVQFHGQSDSWWYFFKEAAISDTGQVMKMVCDENQCRPARIARIRIWIGGDQ